MAFGPDGNALYSVAPDGLLLAWDLDGTRGFPGWRSYSAEPEGIDLARSIPSPDGTKVMFQSYGNGVQDRAIQFRDLTTGDLTPLTEVPGLLPGSSYVWSPDSSMLLTSGIDPVTKAHWLESWDPATGASIRRNDHTPASSATFTSDGSTIIAVDPATSVWRIDPKTLEVEGPPIALPDLDAKEWDYPTLSPDDRTLLVRRWFTNNTIVVMDLATGQTRDVPLGGFPDTWAFSPDGAGSRSTSAVRASGPCSTSRPSARGGSSTFHDASHFPRNNVWEMTYSADGSQIITTGNGVVDLWDARRSPRSAASRREPDDVATARPMGGHTVLIAQPRARSSRGTTASST